MKFYSIFDSYCEWFNVVLKGEIDLSLTQSSTLALHPAFQRRIAVELKWKQSMCSASKLISLPKFLPTMHCQVGKKVSSNSFLSSLARSTSWNLVERDAFYCTNSIAFRRISIRAQIFKITSLVQECPDVFHLPSAIYDFSMRILLSPIFVNLNL